MKRPCEHTSPFQSLFVHVSRPGRMRSPLAQRQPDHQCGDTQTRYYLAGHCPIPGQASCFPPVVNAGLQVATLPGLG